MIQPLIDEIDNTIRSLQQRRATYEKLAPTIEALGLTPSSCGAYLDFDCLPHEQVVLVLNAFHGKWTKTPYDEGRIHYVRDEPIDGVTIRCWAGSPPPNCHVVEEEAEVPEQVIPAHTEMRRRLVCKEEVV